MFKVVPIIYKAPFALFWEIPSGRVVPEILKVVPEENEGPFCTVLGQKPSTNVVSNILRWSPEFGRPLLLIWGQEPLGQKPSGRVGPKIVKVNPGNSKASFDNFWGRNPWGRNPQGGWSLKF